MAEPLSEYRRKRSPGRTPEPFGGGARAPGDAAGPGGAGAPLGRFVIQKHAARRLHYDLRLEIDGVLRSWAVPRGPSFDPAEKRLAVQVEDHPLEYGDFEGLIPGGNYGAGRVIVWDRGAYRPLESHGELDPAEALRKGKLYFELFGYKLRGVWQLLRTRSAAGVPAEASKEWLLIKKADAWAAPEGTRPLSEESVLSGLDLDQLGQVSQPGDEGPLAELRRELIRLDPPRRREGSADPAATAPMLAETAPAPFSRPGWLFELKYDGYRMLAVREGGVARLQLRKGSDAAAAFPEVARALLALPVPRLVMDGEVVVLDAEGRPAFQRLQERAMISRTADADRASVVQPATLMLFDLLAVDDRDLRSLPLRERKALLARIVPRLGPLRFADHVEDEGEALYREVERRGLEGILAKDGAAPYRAGRSPAWLKMKASPTDDFVVVGFTAPTGSRVGFGALELAQHDAGELRYVGRVGTGFTDRLLEELHGALLPLTRPTPPCLPARPEHAGVEAPALPDRTTWVEPRLCCEARFTARTDEGLLRHPVFLRLRDDKRPEECARRRPASPTAGDAPGGPPAPAGAAAAPRVERKVSLTNLHKVFWPAEGYTKGDLVEYYRAVAPWLLPWLRDRPLVITRFPDGIEGKSFFQHDAPPALPGWFRTERVWKNSSGTDGTGPGREVDYLVCQDLESLLYLANLGTLPIHLWSSRAGTLGQPDWCVLDLDPKGAPFAHVVRLARLVHTLCEEMGLPSYPKTSGQAGLHVLVPLGRQLTHEQARDFAGLIARALVDAAPDIATIARVIDARGGKVYVDWLQNGHGKTIAAPLCVRPKPGAPVSMPLAWSEVTARLDPGKFTIRTAPRRLKGRPTEPPILADTPDLAAALAALEKRLRPKAK